MENKSGQSDPAKPDHPGRSEGSHIDFTWKIGGEAGFGIMVTGQIFCKVCTRSGLNVVSTTEYPSLIRGGHNTFIVRASTSQIYSLLQPVNLLVALNKETIDLHKEEVASDGLVVFDPQDCQPNKQDFKNSVELIPVPLLKLAKENNGDVLMRNTVALGVSFGLLGIDFSVLQGVISDQFKRKGEEIVNHNVNAAKAGYDYIGNNLKRRPLHAFSTLKEFDKLVLTGNEAIGLGAISSGLKFFAAYPMTPINGLITFMAAKTCEFSYLYKQPEDEIAAMNMAIGASFSGARSMVATSGGGFDLMNEGLSMAAMTETPIVAVLGQRPGPSSGLPTWTTQGDLRYALHAGHGEFFRFVFTPGDVEEAYYLTKLAFYLSGVYQVPAIILVDKYLCESYRSFNKEKLTSTNSLPSEIWEKTKTINRGKITLTPDKNYKRYQITDDGISPRTFPGRGMWLTYNSYEHNEEGLSTEIAGEIKAMIDKRTRKYQAAEKEAFGPILYGEKKADITLTGWGSTKQAVLEAVKIVKEKKSKLKINYLHYPLVSPFPIDNTRKLLSGTKKIVDVENNTTGPLADLIREKTGIDISEKILKYDGRQFYPEEIVSALEVIQRK